MITHSQTLSICFLSDTHRCEWAIGWVMKWIKNMEFVVTNEFVSIFIRLILIGVYACVPSGDDHTRTHAHTYMWSDTCTPPHTSCLRQSHTVVICSLSNIRVPSVWESHVFTSFLLTRRMNPQTTETIERDWRVICSVTNFLRYTTALWRGKPVSNEKWITCLVSFKQHNWWETC